MTVYEQILATAEALFFEAGVKSTTMDDLARTMGVSKKTLYQYVDNKADLVLKVLERHLELETKMVVELFASPSNAIEQMFIISRHVTSSLKKLNPSIISDLQKYYPRAWNLIAEYKQNRIRQTIEANIAKGIDEGLYRSDVNPQIISRFYSSKADCVVDQKLFPFTDFAVIDVYYEFLNHHIRGLASEKGLKFLEEYKTTNDVK